MNRTIRENAGALRQYLARGADLRQFDQDTLDAGARPPPNASSPPTTQQAAPDGEAADRAGDGCGASVDVAVGGSGDWGAG